MNSPSFCDSLSFTDITINHCFWFHLSYGQSTTLLKDCRLCDSNNWTGTRRSPLIQLPYVRASCLSRNAAPFSESPTSCLSFPDLGSMTSVRSLWGAHCHSLVDVCLLINLSGRLLLCSREEMLIYTAHVSILWWQWSEEHQKMLKMLVVVRLFKVAEEWKWQEWTTACSNSKK